MDSTLIGAVIAAAATLLAAVIAKGAIGRRDEKPDRIDSSSRNEHHESRDGLEAVIESIEILPRLQRKFSGSLRPNLKSIKFCQDNDRCYLQVASAELLAGYLQNKMIKREDLAFISDDQSADGMFFSPGDSLQENARRFVEDFDEVSIINCTDLFTPEAAMAIETNRDREPAAFCEAADVKPPGTESLDG